MTQQTPDIGIYENVPFETYAEWDAVSNSHLSLFARSPRHYAEGFKGEATDPMRLGSLQHCGIFEPLSIIERYAVMPAYELDALNTTANGAPSDSKCTKFYKHMKAQFEAANEGREIVPNSWYRSAKELSVALHENQRAREILNGPGPVEVSIIWDEVIGDSEIRCKARIDKVATSLGIIADLKKCRDVSRFDRTIADFKYHRQLAHYLSGWQSLTGDELTPAFIYHEPGPPVVVLAATLRDTAILQGNQERYRLLAQLADCRRMDRWPLPPNPTEIDLPSWYYDSAPFIAANGEEV